MADALFSSLLTNLNSLAVQEFGIAWGLETELENLKSTLSTIQAVLVDAEAKQWTSEAVENWLRKLKDAAYDADDVVDEFAIEAQRRKLDSQRGVTHRVSSFFSIRNRLIFRLKIGHKIKDVKERLDRIAEEKKSFHLREGLVKPEFRAVEGSQTSSLVNESEIIGRNDEKEMIVKILLDDSSDCHGVSVYAIWGMGGLGKTTLAKLVYNDKRVQGLFNLRIWVTVSDDFDIKTLTRAILESIEGGTCNIDNLDPLQRRLQEKLSGKRFLLVLDDVWNEYHEKWDKLQDVLRCGAKDSKLIVTTRSQKVAHIMAPLRLHRMGRLSEDDAWSLFKQRAFGSGRREENHELDQIGKAIVKKCGGLPLAIKALGSLMQLKSSVSEWLYVKNSDIWDLPDDGSTILPALRLSYDNLPPHARQCFAYCCIFAKDTQMARDMLIELWMANGFIPSKGEASLHDTGHEIFNHLVWRSFLQDVEEKFEGEIVCKMHDLMHDLALSIMQHHLYVANSDKDLKIPEKARHLCLNTNLTEKVPWNEVMLEVKSLRSLVFGDYNKFSGDELARLVLKQKYLRVLHLMDRSTIIEKGLRSISNCKHLRFLNLSHSRIKSVPESVCDLQKLETLKLRDCYELRKLPKRMKHMKNLVYLDIKGCYSLISMPPKLGQLTSLRRLDKFIVGRDEGDRIGELKDLNLRGELSIEKLDNVRSSEDADRANLKKKQDLVSLALKWSASKEEILPNDVEEVLESLQPHKNLKKLTINNYRGLKFPNWMLRSVLKNLVSLSLHSCSRCEQLPPLGKLHSLKNLDIRGMDSPKYFDPECYGDGEISFPALEKLTLWGMPSLEEWTTTDRQYIFPCLRTFDIEDCPKLTKLPSLPKLESLTIEANELLLRAVSNLTWLTSLSITDIQLEILPDGLFQNMKALKSLSIESCYTLENLSGLENLNSLESLEIYDCPSLTDLAVQGLEGLTSLRFLTIRHCHKLRSLPEGMEHLDALQSLDVKYCVGLLSLPNWLGSLQSLSSLTICRCPSLRSMPDGLRGQKNLRELRIRACPHLESRCKKESGEDWLKIAHIPNIEINYEEVQSLTINGQS